MKSDALRGVYDYLMAMCFLSPSAAREKLHQLKRDAEECHLQLGSCVVADHPETRLVTAVSVKKCTL